MENLERKLLKVVFWTAAVVRAIIIVASLAALYFVINLLWIDADFSKTENFIVPGIIVVMLFIYLVASEDSWVEKQIKKLEKNETKMD